MQLQENRTSQKLSPEKDKKLVLIAIFALVAFMAIGIYQGFFGNLFEIGYFAFWFKLVLGCVFSLGLIAAGIGTIVHYVMAARKRSQLKPLSKVGLPIRES